MIEVKHGKLTQDEYSDLSKEMELDLIAVFNLIQEDVLKTLDKAVKEGMSPDTLIKEIEALI